ncbi:transcription elongation factor GreA [Deinococcus radiophilus]|uniref:Transcription elongation factor GreA n=1 Tax=Deinococcus radiophilus TaxID=32062 RepID=A0A431VZQ4_9DEIO|nr:transcription elongation factor GreA [Deinococcus radiophilus]RTR28603.1 transcription elongation factor GreA [Deinococcus radiophilus]UFA51024.1 transcription elongation factor GreA [Deinococcus radiophilus]
MTGPKISITQRGYDRLKETLHHLKTTRREQISENMGRAIADGDLRESAAYDEARMEQSENEARIRDLEDQLERAMIVAEDAAGGAGLGAKVTVRSGGTERTFELVGTFEADVRAGKISDASPIGKALLGASEGDKVKVPGPKGDTEFEVVSVSYE